MKTNNSKLNGTNTFKKAGLSIGFALLCLLITTTSNAQIGLSIGPKAGVSFNSFSTDDQGNFSGNTAALAGAFVNLHLGESFSIQPEFLIHQKGASQNGNSVRLNYFSVPLLAKFMVPIGGIVYPHVLAGPVYNYRLNAKATKGDAGDVTFDNGDLKRTEISGALGAGVDIVSNRVYVNIDGRYNLGFSDIHEKTQQFAVRNRSFTLSLGVGYRFGTPK